MNRTLWIRSISDLSPTEGETLLPPIRRQGFNRIALKAWDGADWQATYDPQDQSAPRQPYGIKDFATLRAWLAAANAHGLALDVWAVLTPDWPKALAFYEQYLRTFPGRLLFDAESYKGFLEGQSPDYALGAIWKLATNVPSADGYTPNRIGLSFDPREMDWLGATAFNRFGSLHPQLYSNDGSWVRYCRQARGRPWEPLLATVGINQNDTWTTAPIGAWREMLRDDVAYSEDGRIGYGVFSAPVTDPSQVAFIQSYG